MGDSAGYMLAAGGIGTGACTDSVAVIHSAEAGGDNGGGVVGTGPVNPVFAGPAAGIQVESLAGIAGVGVCTGFFNLP